jgi:large subunit ribosomal protein L24
MAGMKIRAGDTVEVITGKDAGRRGRVLEAIPAEGRVIVEGRTIAKKHSRPRPVRGSRGAQMTPGGVIEMEAPIRVDNVALVCPRCNAPTRVGYRFADNGDKIRHCRRAGCGQDIEK